MTIVHVNEQECFGKKHFRVFRPDGRTIFDRFQTDFDTESDAILAIRGEFRRKALGVEQIVVKRLNGQKLTLPMRSETGG